MATLTTSSTSTTPSSGRRQSVAALRTLGNMALQPDADQSGTVQNFSLTGGLPTNGAGGTLIANDRFNGANVVALPGQTAKPQSLLTSPQALFNFNWDDFHHSSDNDNLTASDVSDRFATYVRNGGKLTVGALSEEAYAEQLARDRAKKQFIPQDEDGDQSDRFLPLLEGAAADAAVKPRGRFHFFRLRWKKGPKEESEKERRAREEEERKKAEDEAKRKGKKPGEEDGKDKPSAEDQQLHTDNKPGERGSGDSTPRPNDTTTGADAAGVRDTTTGVRDAVTGVRDTATGARDAVTGVRDVAVGAKDLASAARVAGEVGEGVAGLARLSMLGGVVGGVGALVGGVALGTALFWVGGAVLVGAGAYAVVRYVTKSDQQALAAGTNIGGHALVPTDARAAFSQGHVLEGLDKTFGITPLVHGAEFLVQHPAQAWAGLKAAWHLGGMVAGVAGAVLSDSQATQAALKAASDGFTGHNTGGVSSFLTAMQANPLLKQRATATLTALASSPFGAQGSLTGNNDNAPSPSSTGSGRKPYRIAMDASTPVPVRPSTITAPGVLAPAA